MDTHSTGTRIKQLRLAQNLTKEELAKRVGVSDVAVGYWERGDSQPKGHNLLRLAKTLSTTPDFLISGKSDKPTNHIREEPAPYANPKKPTPEAWHTVTGGHSTPSITHLPPGHPIPGIPDGALVYIDHTEPPQAGRIVVADHKSTRHRAVYNLGQNGPQLYLEDMAGKYPPIKLDAEWEIVGIITRIEFDT